jgi:rsbT co-antagonist protein RsbR
MTQAGGSKLPGMVRQYERELLTEWLQHQRAAVTLRRDLLKDEELEAQAREFLASFCEALQNGALPDITKPEWGKVREFLSDLSRLRARQGLSSAETATFVFSLKQPLFERVLHVYGRDEEGLAEDLWTVTSLLDRLGLLTMETYQKRREEVITRQQQELLELSTPVVQLWRGILALPLIGVLDSARTQVVMENLLQKIVETNSEIAIIDITGVPTVDTLVAQHLLKTVAAARLMGADCIISGIRPQIAQTIVHLGIDLTNVLTKASLADAFALALQRTGQVIKDIANGRGPTSNGVESNEAKTSFGTVSDK